jgi:diadenosine tetraphosphate (Ap4A) HIT family hydrolase
LFSIDERLEKGKFFIRNLPLCRVLLQDDSRFPWLVLVPCFSDVTEIYQLEPEQQHILIEEISLVSKILQDYTKADKINVAAFGNMVPQFHIHIVARYKTDSAWPDPVIGLKGSIPYPSERKDQIIDDLSRLLSF